MKIRILLSLLAFTLFISLIYGCNITNQLIQITIAPIDATAKPAVFSVSDLTIEPRVPHDGALYTISVTVTNTGGSQGNYDVNLYIYEYCIQDPSTQDPDNAVIVSTWPFTKSVIIAAGESKIVTFDRIMLPNGYYSATIDGLVDYFESGI